MRINNNIMAMNTHRQYGINNNNVSKSVEKLSSGYRINRAGDDAAGLAISEKMRAQIRGLTMASKNSQDAISLVQTAEGALQETHNILQRMRELAVQSASDTNETTIDRDALNKEFQALIAEIDDTASKTKFNDMGLIDGSFAMYKIATASGGAGTATVRAEALAAVENPLLTAQTFTLTFEVTGGKAAVTGPPAEPAIPASSAIIKFTNAAGKVEEYQLVAGQEKLQLSNGIVVEFGAALQEGFGNLAGIFGITLNTDGNTTAASNTYAITATVEKTNKDFVVQTGANKGDELHININLMDANSLGVAGADVATRQSASWSIEHVNDAINQVSTQRAALGALQNRLDHKIANLDTSAENLQAAESRIRDLDMAKEMTEFTKNNILSQAATAMLAQANSLPQNVLQLLR